MEIFKSPIYYSVCLILLVLLVAALFNLNSKNRSARKTDSTPSAEHHVPKYAAGDEMDRLYRPAPKRQSKWPYIALPIILIITVWAISPSKNMPPQDPAAPPASTTLPPLIRQAVPIQTASITQGPLDGEITSTELNKDNSKVYVTYVYTNNTALPFYNVKTTIQLLNSDDAVLEEKEMELISEILAGESREYTTSLDMLPEYIDQAPHVSLRYQYRPSA